MFLDVLRSSPPRVKRVAGLAILTLCGVLGGCASSGGSVRRPPGRQHEIDGSAVAALAQARAPRVVLVDVWATWCGPCVQELPVLIELDRELDDLEVVFVSADLDAARPEACQTLAELGVPEPYLFQGGSDHSFIDALNPAWSGVLPARFLYRGTEQVAFWEGPLDYGSLRDAVEASLQDGP